MPNMKPHPATTAKLTESELDEIRTLIEQRSAILFDASRERFFSTRVREYLAEKELKSGTDLLRVMRGSSIEYEALLEGLLTQETSFFRYPAIFTALEGKILPEMQERKFWENPRSLRIWSAGCSTGEEPYSIAITLCESLKFAEAWEIEILATDISRDVLQHAVAAVVEDDEDGSRFVMRGAPQSLRRIHRPAIARDSNDLASRRRAFQHGPPMAHTGRIGGQEAGARREILQPAAKSPQKITSNS